MDSDHDRSRRLILLRHAKSQWPDGVRDEDRPLAERGIADAGVAGPVLAGIADLADPDVVLCSPALRTRQTWRLVAPAFTQPPPVRFDPVIYGATPDELIDLIRTVPDGTGSVLVIGHEPTMSATADLLAGPGSSLEAQARLRAKYPTCAIAVLSVRPPWADLAAEKAVLEEFSVPRG